MFKKKMDVQFMLEEYSDIRTNKKEVSIFFYAYADADNYNAQNIVAREMAQRLDLKIYKVHIFCRNIKNTFKEFENKKYISLIEVKSNKKLVRFFTEIYYLFKIKRDFTICDHVNKVIYIYLKFRFLLNNSPLFIHTVANVRPNAYSGRVFNYTAKYICRRSDFLFGNSNFVCQRAKIWSGRHVEYKSLRGVDLDKFYPGENRIDSDIKIISCATLQERKQPHIFLDIAKKHNDIKFVWVGDGKMKKELLARIENESINNFELIPNLDHSSLAEEFRKSYAFLMTSNLEGFPSVIIQAMACGLPVIAFEDYKPEAIIDGNNGFVVNDYEQMDLKLTMLLSDRHMYMNMRKNAILRSKQYDWSSIMTEFQVWLHNIGQMRR